jgi:hypothetical protein
MVQRHDRCGIKLLIEKRMITDEEFKKNLGEKRATYQAMLKLIEQ